MSHESLETLQQSFIQLLIGEPSRLEESVNEQAPLTIKQRLSIYQTAYRARLIDTIRNAHAVLADYLGDALFELMALGYIQSHPSRYRSLRHFCNALPDYLRKTGPFSDKPIFAELAEFERTLLDAFDAADVSRMGAGALAEMDPSAWPDVVIHLHPSVHRFSCDYPCVPLWQAIKRSAPAPEACRQPSDWIIWRNRDQLTEFKSLGADALTLFEGSLEGLNLANLCEQLALRMPADNVSQVLVSVLQTWLTDGLITELSRPGAVADDPS